MLRRSLPKLFKPVTSSRNLTNAAATLRTSPSGRPQDIFVTVGEAPDYLLIVPSNVSFDLSGQDLGVASAKVKLVFHGGCHNARDTNPESPRLTIPPEIASIMNEYTKGAETPATLYYDRNLKGSGIALKGTEGEMLCEYTAQGAKAFSKALKDLD